MNNTIQLVSPDRRRGLPKRNERKLKFELDHNTELSLAKKRGSNRIGGEELTLIKPVRRKLPKQIGVADRLVLRGGSNLVSKVCSAVKAGFCLNYITEIPQKVTSK